MRPVHGGNLVWAAAQAGCPLADIVDFSASISPLGPPPSALVAIQANLSALAAYPNPDYYPLRAALSQAHQIPPDWILPGNGSAELLTWVGWDLSKLQATLLVTPAFGDYWRALQAVNSSVLECPINLDFSSKASLVIDKNLETQEIGLLINNPHNPTGKIFFRESIVPLLEKFALVVVDEAFMDFLPPDEQQSLIPVVQQHENLVILRSLTKFYSLPGLRLGYALAHPSRLARWQAWRDPWPVNTLASAAGIAAVRDIEFQQLTWNWLPPARQQLFEGLSQLPGLLPYPSTANFLLVESAQSSSQVQEKLLKHSKILIRDCLSFPQLGDRYFRVAVRSTTDNQRLIAGLAAILNQN